MFNPSKEEVRRFFCDAWRKYREGQVLSPQEAVAADWISEHPEYHNELIDADAAAIRDYRVEDGRTNPFLHLSMHLAIAEQLSIDQPAGIRAVFSQLVDRHGDEHAAMHEAMECLGQVVWETQRGEPITPDQMSLRYLDCLRRRATR